MNLTFLGTGTSCGVPTLGCTCKVCQSTDSRDKRLRTSALLESEGGTRILIDCGPDFRAQMLNRPFKPLDAVLLTHLHYDHVGGLDDLRPFSFRSSLPIYANQVTARSIYDHMPYCFQSHAQSIVPRFKLKEVSAYQPFAVRELVILPLLVMHGKMPILGFRIGSFAYITDMSYLPDESFQLLQGVETFVVNALQIKNTHPTHQNIPQALQLIAKLSPRHAYLIHMSHNAGFHADSSKFLPPNVAFAYDGLEIKC